MATTDEVVHPSPVWREQADLIVAAPIGLADEGGPKWEQLWARATGPGRATLCCIPFFAYDLSLGDEVRLSDDFVVVETLGRSEWLTFRVWFGGQSATSQSDTLKYLAAHAPLAERASPNLVAFAVKPLASAQAFASELSRLEEQGALVYETAALA